jgi:hypothetical protein
VPVTLPVPAASESATPVIPATSNVASKVELYSAPAPAKVENAPIVTGRVESVNTAATAIAAATKAGVSAVPIAVPVTAKSASGPTTPRTEGAVEVQKDGSSDVKKSSFLFDVVFNQTSSQSAGVRILEHKLSYTTAAGNAA